MHAARLLAALLVILILTAFGQAEAATVFTHAFAPSDGPVAPVERPWRDALCLNGQWRFQAVPVPAGFVRDAGTPPYLPPPSPDGWSPVPIRIPSPWNVNTWGNGRDVGAGTPRPYTPSSLYYPSYPAAWDHVEMAWMQRTFSVPAGWSGKRLVLHFDAVAGECQIVVNGHAAGRHFDSFLPFDIDVTGLLHAHGEDTLAVGVRAADLFDKRSARYPKFLKPYPDGSALDGQSGIWQDVSLLALPPVHVTGTFVQPLVDRDTLRIQVTVRNDTAKPRRVTVGGDVHPWIDQAGHDTLSAPEPEWRLGETVLKMPPAAITIPAGTSAVVTLHTPVGRTLHLWTPDTPHLYGLVVTLGGAAATQDIHYTRFGWRQLKIQGRHLLLNGHPIQLFGDLCHPFGPFMMSRRFAWAWYRMLKDAGCNAVRLHAQPLPPLFMDMADEMGILVLDEDALFGSSIALNLEEPEAWDRFDAHFDGLVRRDRDHPSVFGWSFGNEMFAVLNGLSPDDAALYRAKLVALGRRALTLDPTRPWISCDGDRDLDGALPVWSRHFGLGLPLDELPPASVDKPLMVGESGGSYYARPAQLAPFNGDRAYESYAGRNDALGIDLYRNVVKMARPDLTYFSASETVWFGLAHLPLGCADFSRLPGSRDGVFFGPYREGRWGMQLEHIPPYVTTLNPGWDPSLPLYRPLGMFDALKAALHRPAPLPCAWDNTQPSPARPAPPTPDQATVAFAGNKNSDLFRRLYGIGVPFTDDDASARTLLVDGQGLDDTDLPNVRRRAAAFTARGGTVLVLVRDRNAPMERVSSLLPAPAALTDRSATLLEHRSPSGWTDSFGLPALYFAEDAVDRHIVKCGIGGEFADRGTTLLAASDTDWALFNDVAEAAKCGAVELYEHLEKPSGAVLVTMPQSSGTIALSAIDYAPESEAYVTFWRHLLSNLGIRMGPVRQKWLLPTALASDTGTVWHYTTTRPADGWTQPVFDDGAWKTGRAGFGVDVPGGKPRTRWTDTPGDIWLRTAFDAASDDLDSLQLSVYHDEDAEVYVNGTEIYHASGFVTQYNVVALSADDRRAFHTGHNVVAVHCHQSAGGQYIDVGILSGAAVRPAAAPTGHDLLLNGPQDK